jgi:phosphatidylglycerol:prolipoprotein diacylglycerol transferase
MAFVMLRVMAKRGLIQIPPHRVGDALMWFIGMTLVGGRLGYVLFYQPSLLWTFSDSFPWWGGIAINQGGMASHGAMAGLVFAAWRVSRGWRDDRGVIEGRSTTLHIMDAIALASPFGLFFGRIANFINGELLGRIVTRPGVDGPWWAVQFPQELTSGHAPDLTPEQLLQLAAVAEQAAPGRPFDAQLDVLVAKVGVFADQLRPLLASRHPSQIYQAVAEGLVLGAIVWSLWARPRRAGFIVAVWLVIYGLLRILTETVRLPDDQFANGGRPFGLSRGQWLSVAMIVSGAGLLVWRLRSPGPLIGGWAAKRTAEAAGQMKT